jgi:3-dehydroquinate dehydratase
MKRTSDRKWKIGLIHAREQWSSWWGEHKDIQSALEPIVAHGAEIGVHVTPFVSEYEPEICKFIQGEFDGFIVNPGTFTLYGENFALSLADRKKPYIEVHSQNVVRWIGSRPYKMAQGAQSEFTYGATGVCWGMGVYSYYAALDGLTSVLDNPTYHG